MTSKSVSLDIHFTGRYNLYVKYNFNRTLGDQRMSNLYEQLGGQAAVEAAVDIFYRKVLVDERIAHFFDGVDMEKQAAKQKAFLTMAFGGPHNYSGKDMRDGHKHLVERGLNDSHFDAVVELLGATLTELGVADELIQQVAAIAESTRDDVLNK
jgi:hemoglobin